MDTPIPQSPDGKSILVVDDDSSVRILLREILTERGYRVFEATNGSSACRHVINNKTDLLITDLIMPEQDGLETIQWMQAASPELKIIAISGAVEACYLRIAGVFGAHELLRKPFSYEDLMERVERLLAAPRPSHK